MASEPVANDQPGTAMASDQSSPAVAAKLTLGGGTGIITGAGSGIGKETGFSLAESGVEGVVFADIDEEAAKAAAEESKQYATNPKYRAVARKVDVTKEEDVQRMVNFTKEEFGRIDYLINSAGVGNESTNRIWDLDVAAFTKAFNVNVLGTELCMRAVTEAMRNQNPLVYPGTGRHPSRSIGRGSIVNLGSVSSYIAYPGMTPYVMSKHGVMAITKQAAVECQRYEIRVNAVCPSWVNTPMMDRSFEQMERLRGMVQSFSPLKRLAEVDEVVDYIVFLLSPSATYINGTGTLIDAGLSLKANA